MDRETQKPASPAFVFPPQSNLTKIPILGNLRPEHRIVKIMTVKTGYLASLVNDMRELEKNKMTSIENFLANVLEDVNERFIAHKKEKFVFSISGKYTKTLAYGPRKNQTAQEVFEELYVGTIGPGGILEDGHIPEHLDFLTGKHFPIPRVELYGLLSPDIHFTKVEKQIFLHNRPSGEMPKWTLTDVAKTYLAQDIAKTLWPETETEYGLNPNSTVRLLIGKEEYGAYLEHLAEKRQEMILTAIKKIDFI